MKRNAQNYRIGEGHHRAKHSDDDVELIRQCYDAGMKPTEIARKFEMSINTVNDYVYYRTRAA